MIVNKNTNPERDHYYLGGKIIEILSLSPREKYDYFELYEQINAVQDISMNLYILVLDWLFLLGVIKNSDKGFIEKCF